MTRFSSFLQNEGKTHWSIIPRPLLISTVKRDILFDLSLSSRNSSTSHRLSKALANSPAAQAWLKQRTWGEFCSIKLTWKTPKSQLVLPLFQAERLPLSLTLAVLLFHSYTLEKSQIFSHICFTKHLFLYSENSPGVSLTEYNGWTSSKWL